MTQFTIGKLAKIAGVNVETIRYYQRRGLLKEPSKPLVGYRSYTDNEVKRLIFIKRAQALGFSLSEIEQVLGLDNHCKCSKTREITIQKIRLIDQKIEGLTLMKTVLNNYVQLCHDTLDESNCPIIDQLSEIDVIL